MDNEKYGIELELITSKFNQQMQQTKNAFKSLENTQIDMSRSSNADILARKIKLAEQEAKRLESAYQEANNALQRQLNYLEEIAFKSNIMRNYSPQQRMQFIQEDARYKALLQNLDAVNARMENQKIKVDTLKNKYDELTKTQNKLSTNSTKSSLNLSNGLDRMTSKIKRFGLALLSVRSIYSLVSRASSAYLAQNTELSNRLQNAWVALGSLLAPIIERIVSLIEKAVKYIAIFIKALTGVDLLAKASAKSMGGAAKSAKALNKALAGFDELQNLDTDAGGGAGDIGASLGGLEDVKIDTKWADRIEKFGKWFKSNWDAVLAGFAGLVTFAKVLMPLIEAFGLKLGIIKALGIGLLIAGIVYSVSALIQYLKDPSWKNFGKIIQGIGVALLGLGVIIGGIPVIVAGAIVLIVGTIIKYWEQIKSFLQKGIDWLVDKTDWVGNNFGKFAEYVYKMFTSTMQLVLNVFDSVFKSIKGVFDGIITFLKGVFTGNWKQAWEGIKQIFGSVWNGMKDIVTSVMNYINTLLVNVGGKAGEILSSAFRAVVNGVMGAIERILNSPIRAINSLISAVNQLPNVRLSKLSTFSLPRLNTGTNYVPQDQLAMIHKGEAVIPKKFNSQEYFGNANEETNELLKELIERVGEIEINPYTTIKDVGKASLSYINNKTRQLGESVVV